MLFHNLCNKKKLFALFQDTHQDETNKCSQFLLGDRNLLCTWIETPLYEPPTTPATATGVLVAIASEPSWHTKRVASRLLIDARTYSRACSSAYVSLRKKDFFFKLPRWFLIYDDGSVIATKQERRALWLAQSVV